MPFIFQGILFFGLHLGESMQLAALGIVGELIKTSRTVGEAISHAAAFGNLLTNTFQMTVSKTSKRFIVKFEVNEAMLAAYPETTRQMIDLSLMMTIHELDGLILKKISPSKVSLPYTEPQRHEYTRSLRCEPTLANEIRMEFENSLWQEPIISAHYELQLSLMKFASAELSKIPSSVQLKQKISQYLLTHAYLGIPGIEEIAANFKMSARTLQRKLSDEGVTYQAISDDIRKSLALNYLHTGNYQLKEISAMLGYNEISAFARAFKRWTGNSPAKYQQTQQRR